FVFAAMWLVVGLGNPGKKYESNRHNVGFMAATELVRQESLGDFREKFSGLFLRANASFGEVCVLEPQTFMNLSGDSVQPCAAFLKIAPQEIVVIHDELDLPFGDVRIKQGGGHAGHNGLRSMIERLGTPDFVRIRIGIGRPPPGFRGEVADYVLSNFDAIEKAELTGVLEKATSAFVGIAKDGISAAMKQANTRKKA
ncbi:MAG: aminoacyl-tRNA hydrolase, partial [Polyangiaceae bacterium]